MKIIFIGCVESSFVCLSSLIKDEHHEIVGVITRSNSLNNSDYIDLTKICIENNISFTYWNRKESSVLEEWIKIKKPDIGICIGWSQLLGKNILDIPPFGFIGFHPAQLPMNRGRHPLIWALFLGLQATASTIFKLVERADFGDILDQKIIKIAENDTACTLYNRILDVLPNQLISTLSKIESGTIKFRPQLPGEGNEWRKRDVRDGVIDWRMNGIAIVRLVKALSHPYPGALVVISGESFKVWDAALSSILKPKNIEPGKVLAIDRVKNIIDVASYDSIVRICKHELPNSISVGDYLL